MLIKPSLSGMHKMTPPIKDLLPRLTPILKNRHEKVQENCIDLVGRIADRSVLSRALMLGLALIYICRVRVYEVLNLTLEYLLSSFKHYCNSSLKDFLTALTL